VLEERGLGDVTGFGDLVDGGLVQAMLGDEGGCRMLVGLPEIMFLAFRWSKRQG
jgi:hypothetical protein